MTWIRRAGESEARLLSELALRSKAHWGYTAEFIAACREELSVSSEAIRSGLVFVASLDEEIRGFYTLEVQADREAELGHLFVEPTHMGKGYGKALLEHAVEVARGMGLDRLVIQGDPHARGFYESCGARHVCDRASASIPDRELPVFELSLVG